MRKKHSIKKLFFYLQINILIMGMLIIPFSIAYGAHCNIVLDNPQVINPALNLMVMQGTIQINNQNPEPLDITIPGDVGDEICVFFNEILCGTLHISQDSNQYILYSYNNDVINNGPVSGSILNVKIWDESENKEYDQEVVLDILEDEIKDAQGNLIWKVGQNWHVNLSVATSVQIFSIQPTSAYNNVSTSVTITGKGFTQGIQAKLGIYSLSNEVYYNSTTFTAVVPSGLPPGTYNLSAVNPDGRFALLSQAFEVKTVLQPVINFINPSEGTNDQVTTLNIYGENFAPGLQVKLGALVLTNVNYISTGYIQADVPTGVQPGMYDVTVINPGMVSDTKINAFLVQMGTGERTVDMDLPSGWSIISLPVNPDDASVGSVFPEAVVVYSYEKEKGYIRVSEEEALITGKGYWLLLNNARTYSLTGNSINKYTLTVYQDKWDMIGGCSLQAEASVDSCNINIIYRFIQDVGYQQVLESENLLPGKGYWILFNDVAGQCKLKVETTTGF